MTPPSLRIAILTHSTNPRGGVVHALELAEVLCRLGHRAVVHAPDPEGTGFFRPARCPTVSVRAAAVGAGMTAMVEARIADYIRHFRTPRNRCFDVWHAQDGISANALATLKEEGLLPAFARTVHHVDSFADPHLQRLQDRGISVADRLLVVSRLWCDALAQDGHPTAQIVGNGVDRRRFSPVKDETDREVIRRLVPAGRSVFLAVGGVEERKNSIRILEAFRIFHQATPSARLVIAGGASILDHSDYQNRFTRALDAAGLPDAAVIRLGPVPQDLMPALYRRADALVFPSLREGFGLAVLEAMASGVPVVTAHLPPFTQYLGDGDVLWCDPENADSIAAAMDDILDSSTGARLRRRGLEVAGRHDWTDVALRHQTIYQTLAEPCHA